MTTTAQDLIALVDEYATQMVRNGYGRLAPELRNNLLAAFESQQQEIEALREYQEKLEDAA